MRRSVTFETQCNVIQIMDVYECNGKNIFMVKDENVR